MICLTDKANRFGKMVQCIGVNFLMVQSMAKEVISFLMELIIKDTSSMTYFKARES